MKRNERKLLVVHTRNAISPLAFGDIVCLLDSLFPLLCFLKCLEYKLCNDIPYSLIAANHQPRLVGGKDMDYAFLDFSSCQILTLLLSPARLLLRLQGVCSSSLFWSLTLNFEF